MEKQNKTNLNEASKDQLMAIPGVDEDLASRIIAYRRVHGGFRNIEELRGVGALPGITIDDLKAEVFV